MKKIVFLIITLLLVQSVFALSAGEARDEWKHLKDVSKEKRAMHQDAKLEFSLDKSDENRQAVVETGKDSLNAALDEAEAWLVWKDLEAKDNDDIPSELRNTIRDDVAKNLDVIDGLRIDVDKVTNQLELAGTFLKMVGKYVELLTDVARDSGKVLVHVGNTRLDTAEGYEAKLRDAAGGNDAALELLDSARDSIDEARGNVERASSSYDEVVLPGTPLIKFGEGNSYMRTAKMNLLSAHADLNQAYRLIVRGDQG